MCSIAVGAGWRARCIGCLLHEHGYKPMNMGIFKVVPGEPIPTRLSGHIFVDRHSKSPVGSRPKEVQSTLGVQLPVFPLVHLGSAVSERQE